MSLDVGAMSDKETTRSIERFLKTERLEETVDGIELLEKSLQELLSVSCDLLPKEYRGSAALLAARMRRAIQVARSGKLNSAVWMAFRAGMAAERLCLRAEWESTTRNRRSQDDAARKGRNPGWEAVDRLLAGDPKATAAEAGKAYDATGSKRGERWAEDFRKRRAKARKIGGG
ncbi:MAG: hypothetical protein AB7J34_25260 [Limisphaerales bacterium]